MTVPQNTATTPAAIEATFTVTLTMSPAQVEAYAREYSIGGPPIAPVGRDIHARLQDEAGTLLDSEYWISTFTTVTVSPPRLAVRIVVGADETPAAEASA